MSLGDARREAGLSQRELSELSGVPRRTIQDWERLGCSQARAGELAKVAEALGVGTESLLRPSQAARKEGEGR